MPLYSFGAEGPAATCRSSILSRHRRIDMFMPSYQVALRCINSGLAEFDIGNVLLMR